MKNTLYDTDLAYVHERGFSNFAKNAAKMIVKTLEEELSEKGLIVDLGCGSGVVAKELLEKGYKVHGIDISHSLIEMAKQRAPKGVFSVGSFFEMDLPNCLGVISTSECFNYATSGENSKNLSELFSKVYRALDDQGVFIFDMIEAGTACGKKSIVEQTDWTMFLHTYEQGDTLTRDVTLFREVERNLYRKSHEVHTARLYPHSVVVSLLEEVGFEVSVFKEYDALKLDEHHFGYLCRKGA